MAWIKTAETENSKDSDEAANNRWMDEVILHPFQQHFISIVSGWWEDDDEKLCAMEPSLWFENIPSDARIKPRTSWSEGNAETTEITGSLILWVFLETYEPKHDKTNWYVHPA